MKKQVEKVKKASQQELENVKANIPNIIKEEVSKAQALAKKEAFRYPVPWNMNSNYNPDRKPGSDVPFSYLRRMAVLYPIARACINRRIRQITGLKWDITTIDELEDEKGFESQIAQVKAFFKQPMGNKTRTRELLTLMVDDTLTLDAVCFEKSALRGGQFDVTRGLIPVDPTTIALRVTEYGGTPTPPEIAYAQIIRGEKVAEFTTDEMIYESMGTRSYSPYGLAPLESLILQTEAALRGTLYNLNYFKESNVPEGFITLPEDVASSKQQVQEWQDWFDAITAGDPRFMRRLKILPGGAEYMAAKKPEDMAFERFELWLLQQTCAVFDVQPQDIGITHNINKATSESQAQVGKERGLIPLANFVKEILDDVIQFEMGFENLQWAWTDINPVDRKEEVEIAEKEINMGVLGADEYRIEHGRQPLGLGAHIPSGRVLVEDFTDPKLRQQKHEAETAPKTGFGKPGEDTDKTALDEDDAEQMDLRKWRKCVYADLQNDKPLRRKFNSEWIKPETAEIISEALKGVHNKSQAKLLFDQFLDPELKASFKLLKLAQNMRRVENAEFDQ